MIKRSQIGNGTVFKLTPWRSADAIPSVNLASRRLRALLQKRTGFHVPGVAW